MSMAIPFLDPIKQKGEKMAESAKFTTYVGDLCHNERLLLSSAAWFVQFSLLFNCYGLKEVIADSLPKHL